MSGGVSMSSLAMGALAATVVSQAMAPDAPSMPSLPTAATTPTMPLPNDAAVQAAKKKQIASQMQASGRMATILSNSGSGSDTLG